MNVTVTGSLSLDYIMDFPGRFADRIMADKIHKISLSFLVNTLNKQFGGVAGNIAYSLKLLGVEPTILSPAGNDFDAYAAFLKRHKISIASIPIHKNVATGSYFVVTDQEDNQIGSFYIGAMKYADKLSIHDLASKGIPLRSKGSTKGNFVIIAPNDPKAMKKFVRECQEAKLPYLYDPAFQIGNFTAGELQEGIEGAQIFIGNDYEIALIEEKLEISHEELRVMVPIVVTTLGSKGSVVETRKDSIHVKPAKPKNVSDPTGAGDAYRAGFLAGYLRFIATHSRSRPGLELTGDELLTCGQMGSVAAVYTVEKYGTVTHHYTKEEFISRYKTNYNTLLRL